MERARMRYCSPAHPICIQCMWAAQPRHLRPILSAKNREPMTRAYDANLHWERPNLARADRRRRTIEMGPDSCRISPSIPCTGLAQIATRVTGKVVSVQLQERPPLQKTMLICGRFVCGHLFVGAEQIRQYAGQLRPEIARN